MNKKPLARKRLFCLAVITGESRRSPGAQNKPKTQRPKTEVRSPRPPLHYNRLVPLLRNLRVTLEMIKWEHSIFALPFALCGAMLAAGGFPTVHQLLWIVIAMVAARSAAMAFNRLADASIDAANPRTSARALPAGVLSPMFVTTFVVISSVVFILAAAQLNRLALWLSPVALAVLLLYSYTKRFTRWSHLVLGFALGIAPAAAWIAVRGSLDPRILLLTAAVTFWVGGFDVLYACQDFDFDRQTGLHSIPRHLGIPRRTLGGPRVPRDHAGAADYVALVVRPGQTGHRWSDCRRRAAGLRAFPGRGRRSEQAECSFLHHEWRDLRALFRLRRRRPAAAGNNVSPDHASAPILTGSSMASSRTKPLFRRSEGSRVSARHVWSGPDDTCLTPSPRLMP